MVAGLTDTKLASILLRRIPTEGGDSSSLTPLVIAGVPDWLEDTSFSYNLERCVQEDLQLFGLLHNSVAAFLWPSDACHKRRRLLNRGVSTTSLRYSSRQPHLMCEESGIRVSIRLMSDRPWPIVKSIAVECHIEDTKRPFRGGSLSSVDDPDWANDLWTARHYWEKQLLSGLAQHEGVRGVSARRTYSAETATTLAGREESIWQKHGPQALATLLSELILNCAMHDAAVHLEATMLDTMRSLPFWPEGPLDVEEHFPPLQLADSYCDEDKQWSPELFLRLASVVWTAASHGVQALNHALEALQQCSVPLDRLALNTPVIYRSAGRSRTLAGPLLMFVVDQMTRHESAREIVQAVVAASADVNSSYVLFPTGKHKAVGRFPVLCLAGNRQALDFAEAGLCRKICDVRYG